MTESQATSPAAKPGSLKSDRLAYAALIVFAHGLGFSIFSLTRPETRELFGVTWLWGFAFVWTVVMGALFFVTLQHATGSLWSVTIRRVAEFLAEPLWLLALFFIPLLILSLIPAVPVYSWMDNPEELAHSSKSAYLNKAFFIVRALLFFAVWLIFGRWFILKSWQQDVENPENNVKITQKMRKLSRPFLILFAFTLTFASFDWLMSLTPHWYSSIYGVYIFAGSTVTALACINLLVLWLGRKGRLPADMITPDHMYNFGGLLFAFSCFWAYVAFSQFMLIWYGNIPEETVYYIQRLSSPWRSLTVVLIFLRFIVPFLILLSRRAKTHNLILVIASFIIIIGQIVDLYWMIMPQTSLASAAIKWYHCGPLLLMVGILLWIVARLIRRRNCVAIGDPLLETSRHFHL